MGRAVRSPATTRHRSRARGAIYRAAMTRPQSAAVTALGAARVANFRGRPSFMILLCVYVALNTQKAECRAAGR